MESWKQDPRYEAWRSNRYVELQQEYLARKVGIRKKYELLKHLDYVLYQKDVEALKRNFADYKDSLIKNVQEKINMEKSNFEYLQGNLTISSVDSLDTKSARCHNLRKRNCKKTRENKSQILLSPEGTDNETFSPNECNDSDKMTSTVCCNLHSDLDENDMATAPVGDLDVPLLRTENYDETKRFADCAALMGHQIADLFAIRQTSKRGKVGSEKANSGRLRHDSVVSTYNTLLSENEMEYLFKDSKLEAGDITFRRPMSPPSFKRRRNADLQVDNKSNSMCDGSQKYLRVDSTRLYYDKYCFPYQCKVLVQNKDSYPVPCSLMMIDKDQVLFRRQTDSGQIRVTLESLRNGKVQLEPF